MEESMKWFRVFMRNTDKEKIKGLYETVKNLLSTIDYWKKSRSELEGFSSDVIKAQSNDIVRLKVEKKQIEEKLQDALSVCDHFEKDVEYHKHIAEELRSLLDDRAYGRNKQESKVKEEWNKSWQGQQWTIAEQEILNKRQ
jgi:tRNA C32,U32 (ribose-2'-O)-methylase TrmJ